MAKDPINYEGNDWYTGERRIAYFFSHRPIPQKDTVLTKIISKPLWWFLKPISTQ
jgi:hypothetical protein